MTGRTATGLTWLNGNYQGGGISNETGYTRKIVRGLGGVTGVGLVGIDEIGP